MSRLGKGIEEDRPILAIDARPGRGMKQERKLRRGKDRKKEDGVT